MVIAMAHGHSWSRMIFTRQPWSLQFIKYNLLGGTTEALRLFRTACRSGYAERLQPPNLLAETISTGRP